MSPGRDHSELEEATGLLRKQLSGRAGKLTPQRRAVLEAVLATHDHFSVEELYLALKRRRAGISLASLYRTIPLLVEGGIVRAVPLGPGRARYEHCLGHEHHDHLVCLACGRVIEIEHKGLERTQAEACRRHGFAAEGRSFVVRGRCRDCRKRGAR